MNKFLNRYLPIFLSVTLIVTATLFWYAPKASASCGNGFSYCRSVTVQAAQVPSTQTNFTWLVCANATQGNGNACPTVAGLNQTGGGAHVQNSNGYDVTFWTGSGCTGTINWEMEKYVASTGEMEAWVLSSSLSNGTVIYMCYGNSTISTFQGGAQGSAWDGNYLDVLHLPNGSSLSTTDSTSNNNTNTNNGTTAGTGQIDGGGTFTHTTPSYITTPAINLGTSFTVEAWVNLTSMPAGNGTYYRIAENNYGSGFYLGTDGGSSDTSWTFIVNGNFGGSGGTLNTNTWTHLVGTYDGTTQTLYVNGTSSGITISGTPSIGSATVNIGASGTNPFSGESWQGVIDEVRFSTIARSANWINTEYNNESAPSTFEAFGSEQQNSGNLPDVVIPYNAKVTIPYNSKIIIN